MVICNLQKTPLDSYACLIIHAKCDDVIQLLMQKLNMAIPQFKLQKWLRVKLQDLDQGKDKMTVAGVDRDGGPFELFKSIRINGPVRNQVTLKKTDNDLVAVTLTFQGHYNENILQVNVSRKMLWENTNKVLIKMVGDPFATAQKRMRFTNWETPQAYLNQNELLGPLTCQ